MLPRPGADDAVSNAMPSCAKIRAKNCIVRFSFPGGLVVLIWRYSRTRWTASSCSLASSGDCWARRRGIPTPGARVMTTNATLRRRMASFRGGEDVEVRRDRWVVPHIYAKTQHDLFFAQGFVAAQDRLFQMDLWRRIGEGRLAEVLGPSYFARDRFARLLKYRGDMSAEWSSYAPDTRAIAASFVSGINAHIALV